MPAFKNFFLKKSNAVTSTLTTLKEGYTLTDNLMRTHFNSLSFTPLPCFFFSIENNLES